MLPAHLGRGFKSFPTMDIYTRFSVLPFDGRGHDVMDCFPIHLVKMFILSELVLSCNRQMCQRMQVVETSVLMITYNKSRDSSP
jgi:hypothetical protein